MRTCAWKNIDYSNQTKVYEENMYDYKFYFKMNDIWFGSPRVSLVYGWDNIATYDYLSDMD